MHDAVVRGQSAKRVLRAETGEVHHFDDGWPGQARRMTLARDDDEAYAAFGSDALVSANAQSIHCVSSATSLASTVAPHQMRRPAGASR